MSAPNSKKIDVGSMAPLVKELGQLYTYYFDHSYYIQNEIKNFIREFETKRGETDTNLLAQSLTAIQNASNACDTCKQLGEATLDDYLSKVKLSIEKANATLAKEQEWSDKRRKTRETHMIQEEKECDEFLAQQDEAKRNIDLNIEEKKKQLQAEYQF
eukprot:TRINITY_DN7019_c0_g1_i3.p1 TRINITY_DN7019_c0_g1~~TRINITY_DN7019_c0_g1_i3.p1  ORF type:complete len:158 (+),score=31.01 TRINITY_DN7019_c0_g1_i3:60-533(+)